VSDEYFIVESNEILGMRLSLEFLEIPEVRDLYHLMGISEISPCRLISRLARDHFETGGSQSRTITRYRPSDLVCPTTRVP
jgi:hypothetical protein